MYQSHLIEHGFWCIEENGVRCFLLEGKDEALLIDAGFGSGDLKAYLTELTSLPVRKLLVTHADMDHLGCAAQFEQVLMHPAEFDRYASSGRDCTRLTPIREGDEISVGHWRLTVILIPGHTPGSIALLDKTHRFLIGGDSIQNSAIYMFGPGRNLPAFIHSMDYLQRFTACFDRVYASHGDLTVTPEIIQTLKEGALQVLEHSIDGTEPPRELPCKLYRWKNTAFLYDI